MQLSTKALVLSSLKYQEKSLIVKCFTQEKGLVSFFVRNAFSKGKNSVKIAYFQPLTLLDIEVQYKGKGNLEYFKEVRLAHPYHTIYSDFAKSSIAIFVSEVLHRAIVEEQANKPFFNFLETAMLWLDTNDQIANFHLLFLVETTKYLGFYPDVSLPEKIYFSSEKGVFTNFYEIGCLSAEQTLMFRKLLKLSFRDDQKVFNHRERRELLDLLMRFYELHLAGFRVPNSLEVLKEIFSK